MCLHCIPHYIYLGGVDAITAPIVLTVLCSLYFAALTVHYSLCSTVLLSYSYSYRRTHSVHGVPLFRWARSHCSSVRSHQSIPTILRHGPFTTHAHTQTPTHTPRMILILILSTKCLLLSSITSELILAPMSLHSPPLPFSFSQSLRRELISEGVFVTLALPGAIRDTPFASKAGAEDALIFRGPGL